MNVKLLEVQGYCNGVKNALDKINNIKTDKKVYLLGESIHNKIIIDYYQKKGYILLSEKDGKKEDLIKDIYNSLVVLQAHGSSDEVYNILKENNNEIVDCTCKFVKLIHENIKKYYNDGYDIIYIGNKKHQETIASLSQVSKIHLIENINDIDLLNIDNDKIMVTNQTTMSLIELKEIYDQLENKYPNIIINNKLCLATTKRQEAVLNINKTDLIIVVGDKSSSNCNKLYKIALTKAKAIFIESYKELINFNFKNINDVIITSGASTPNKLVIEVKDYLLSLA